MPSRRIKIPTSSRITLACKSDPLALSTVILMDDESHRSSTDRHPAKSRGSFLLRRRTFFRWPNEFWPSVMYGTAMAGGLYPIFMSLMNFSMNFSSYQLNSGQLIPFSLAFLAICSLSFIIGWAFASVVSAFAVLLLRFILRSLHIEAKRVVTGAFIGGLTGLVCTSPFVLTFTFSSNQFYLYSASTLATLMGQIGGAWGAWRMLRNKSLILPTKSLLSTIHFRISHMLWFTFWSVLLLTVLKLAGLLTPPVITFLGIWFVFQTVSLAVIWQIERALRRRLQRRLTEGST